MKSRTIKTLAAAIFMVLCLCAFTYAQGSSISALKQNYESRYQNYLSLLTAGADDKTLEISCDALIEAKNRYLAALKTEAERPGNNDGQTRNEILKLEKDQLINNKTVKTDLSAGVPALKNSNAASSKVSSKASRIKDGGALKNAGVSSKAASTASNSTGGGFWSKVSAGASKVKNFFARAAASVKGFFSSAQKFVSDTVEGVTSDKYDETDIEKTVPPIAEIRARSKDFSIGVNFPWLPGGYGWDIGSHDSWGTKFNEKITDETFAKMAGLKLSVVRWFLYCDGRANPKFDNNSGLFKYPDERFSADFDKIMELARKHHIKIVWSFLDFHWFKKDAPNFEKYSKIARDQDLQKDFIEKAIMPIVKKYADDEAIFAWEVINEPEWITANVTAPGAPGQISVSELQGLVKNATAAIHSVSKKPVTVGSANPKWMYLYVNTGIDMFQAHYYDKGSKIAKKTFSADEFKRRYKIDKPVILGEFASKGSRYTIGQYINMAVDSGYDGAWVWGYHSEDEATAKNNIDAMGSIFRSR